MRATRGSVLAGEGWLPLGHLPACLFHLPGSDSCPLSCQLCPHRCWGKGVEECVQKGGGDRMLACLDVVSEPDCWGLRCPRGSAGGWGRLGVRTCSALSHVEVLKTAVRCPDCGWDLPNLPPSHSKAGRPNQSTHAGVAVPRSLLCNTGPRQVRPLEGSLGKRVWRWVFFFLGGGDWRGR